jgi:AcrR family transcriptional regulator
MEGLAARAEVSKGLVYHYFANRAVLLLALIERERGVYDARAEVRRASVTTLRDWIATGAAALLDAAEERGAVFIALFNQRLIEREVEEQRRERRERAIRATARRVESDFGLSERRSRIVSTLLTGALTAGADLVARGLAPRAEVEDEYLQLVESVIAGIKSRQ